MNPVLILEHLSAGGPASLGSGAAEQGAADPVFNSEARDRFPENPQGFSALAVPGGEMSANDPLPSRRQGGRLIQQAVRV